MPKGRHTHYLRTSGRMLLSGMRSHERNYDANVATKIYIAINQLSFCICLITHSFYFYANSLQFQKPAEFGHKKPRIIGTGQYNFYYINFG